MIPEVTVLTISRLQYTTPARLAAHANPVMHAYTLTTPLRPSYNHIDVQYHTHFSVKLHVISPFFFIIPSMNMQPLLFFHDKVFSSALN